MSAEIRDRVLAIAQGQASDADHGRIDTEAAKQLAPAAQILSGLAHTRTVARPMHMPSQAFGIWG